MMRINLLPHEKPKKNKIWKEIQSQLVATFSALFIFVLVLGYVTTLLNKRIETLALDEARLVKELEGLKAKLKEVEDHERDKKTVEEKIKLITKLRKNQSAPVYLLDEITRSLPERVWLIHLSEQSGVIGLEGKAASTGEIVDFINNLKKSPLFNNVRILESRQNLEGKGSTYSFRLEGALLS